MHARKERSLALTQTDCPSEARARHREALRPILRKFNSMKMKYARFTNPPSPQQARRAPGIAGPATTDPDEERPTSRVLVHLTLVGLRYEITRLARGPDHYFAARLLSGSLISAPRGTVCGVGIATTGHTSVRAAMTWASRACHGRGTQLLLENLGASPLN